MSRRKSVCLRERNIPQTEKLMQWPANMDLLVLPAMPLPTSQVLAAEMPRAMS